MALNLAAALRARGHDAQAWAPGDVPAGVRWWQNMAWKRRAVLAHVESTVPYDIVDAPPVAISAQLTKRACTVARSVQPDLLYLACEGRASIRHLWRRPLQVLSGLVYSALLAKQVLVGWHRARLILCLGSIELAWMQRWFPWLRRKLACYPNALADEDREALKAIRLVRSPRASRGMKYLWLGRWTPHKGTDRLVAFIMERLHSSSEDTFTIAGCGSEAADGLPEKLRKDRRVRILPSYTRENLFRLLREHDAGLFTSVVEGWGLSLNEMLGSGMPVYATRTGAVNDLWNAFPELLREFPPPNGGAAELPRRSRDSVGDTCTWAKIAADYCAMCGAILERHGL